MFRFNKGNALFLFYFLFIFMKEIYTPRKSVAVSCEKRHREEGMLQIESRVL